METSEKLTKTKWVIDPAHSEIAFKVKHLMITNVKGVFTEFEASIYTTEENFMTAEIDFWMNPASIDSKDARRDEHLKSADFFDVEKFKEITFTANTFEDVDKDGSYSSDEKLLDLMKNYPEFLQRFPQNMLASYLGISPETFSRVRKQIKAK